MTKEQALEALKPRISDYLSYRGIDPSQNFPCYNPEHNDTNPSMGIDKTFLGGNVAHCFGCGAHYDIVNLIMIDYDVNFWEALKIGCDMFDIPFNPNSGSKVDRENQKQAKSEQNKPLSPMKDKDKTKPVLDLTAEIEAAAACTFTPEGTPAYTYYRKRGLSDSTIKRHKLGYSPNGYNGLMEKYEAHRTKGHKAALYRFILPHLNGDGSCNYFTSEIVNREQVDGYNGKYRKIAGGVAQTLFNEYYLTAPTPPKVLYICEGIYDALSVEEAGASALALVGVAESRLIQLCRRYMPDTMFIIALDNDSTGTEAAKKIMHALDGLGLPFMKAGSVENYKDYNEALVGYPAGFKAYISRTNEEALRLKEAFDTRKEAEENKEREEYLNTNAAAHLQDFINGISESANTPYYPTGFASLDKVLDGGLYEGLYFIGAISSLGKTTFALQIADNLAQQGHDVLIFSLEMARAELMAKSISRLTLLGALERDKNTANAKTVRGITVGKRYAGYSAAEKDLIKTATTQYGEYASHLFIHEGVGNIGVEQIKETVAKHIKYTGNTPIVLIDYVQILAPYDTRATDKQNTDKAVLELKRLSRDYKIPIIGISSFNRDNYKEKVNLAALKESGALEYGSDVVLGLQLKGTGTKGFDVDEAKQKNPREIELRVLKNRNGQTGGLLDFTYYSMFNYFKEGVN